MRRFGCSSLCARRGSCSTAEGCTFSSRRMVVDHRRYNYRIDGKFKTLALGIYPDVPLAKARVRHLLARQLLADGIDPSVVKKVGGKRFESAALESLRSNASDRP